MYGRILADLGLLSKGEVVYKCASDFIGDVLGSSEKTTRAIIESAQGCVLVIDEAYALFSGGKGPNAGNDPYKTAVIDTIVEQVQATPGADIAVVMLGYQAEMENMLAKVNPGLSRRFQLENAFHFPDFDDKALMRILMAKARDQQIGLTLSVAKRAVRTLAKARAKPNFGNAGAVDNMLSEAISRMQIRGGSNGGLIVDDFAYSGDEHDESSLETLFDGLIGCREVRAEMDVLRNTVVFSKAQGKPAASSVSYNYLFLGSPGTGKTTVARRMGKMFEALGLLPGCEMKEIKASELLTGYVGQAGHKTKELLREARGGVLFIDEAYQLNPTRGGSFMTEAVDELVGALTEEEFKGKLLVILAGYDQDMEEMLSVNPGLKSRFSERVHFHDFDANATAELLQMELERKEIPLVDLPDLNDLCRLAQRLVDSEGFGNGRDVMTWADRIFKQVAKKYSARVPLKSMGRQNVPKNSSLGDVSTALDSLLSSRKVRTGGPQCGTTGLSDRNPLQAMMDTSMVNAPPPTRMVTEQKIGAAEDCDQPMDDANEDGLPENYFEGIDERILRSLQDFTDEEGLGSEEGVLRLSKMDPSSPEFMDLVTRLVDATGMDPVTARDQLLKWQRAQKDVQKTIEQTKSAVVGARPIWRCAVCGQANKPWIACYVAPYIVGYEQVTVGDI